MSTLSIATINNLSNNIIQGDVFRDVSYCYIDKEDDDTVELVEFVFPMAIVVSQACDVNAMSEMLSKSSGKATKFMPSVLMCPIYGKEEAKSTKHLEQAFTKLQLSKEGNEQLFNSKEYSIAENDWHYRYHALKVIIDSDIVLENALIDFKHYFTVPASYLFNSRENRLFTLGSLFAEQITLKFSTYLSRVAIP